MFAYVVKINFLSEVRKHHYTPLLSLLFLTLLNKLQTFLLIAELVPVSFLSSVLYWCIMIEEHDIHWMFIIIVLTPAFYVICFIASTSKFETINKIFRYARDGHLPLFLSLTVIRQHSSINCKSLFGSL